MRSPFDRDALADCTLVDPVAIKRGAGRVAVDTMIRYVMTALPPGSPVRDRILEAFGPEHLMMYMSVYEEMRAEGRIESQRKALLKLLAHRGLALAEPLRARVLACTQEARLERWFDRALTATTLTDVFAEP